MFRSLFPMLLAAMLLLSGCGRAAETPAETEMPVREEVSLPAAVAAEPAEAASETTRTVDGTLSLSGEQLRAQHAPALHVLAGGNLTADGLTLDRIAQTEALTQEQAAILVENGGQTALTGAALASDASDAPLLLSRGNAKLADTVAVLSGARAAILLATEGGSIRLLRCSLLANGGSSICLAAKNGSRIDCTENMQITAQDPDGSAILLEDGGQISISGGTVSGNLRFSGMSNALQCTNTVLTGDLCFDYAEDEIHLELLGGSVFTGTTDGEGAMGVFVTLDAESRWVLTGDAYVAALSNADETFSNIESNGNTLYYNAEAEANAWLGARSVALSGGGFLIPLI